MGRWTIGLVVGLVACETIVDPSDLRGADEVKVKTPRGWDFLFALDMSAAESATLDGHFEVGADALDGAFDLVDGAQLVVGKVESLDGYGERLRFTTKATVTSDTFVVDRSADVLGAATGDQGPGLYAFYQAQHRIGFIAGKVADCDGQPADDVLVTTTGGPFFSRSTRNGNWGVPAITVNTRNEEDAGVPVTVHFDAGDCSGGTTVGTGPDENPKTGDVPYPHEETDDGSDVIEVDVDLGEDRSGWTPPPKEGDGAWIDFEDGSFSGTGIDCQVSAGAEVTVMGDSYGSLFEDGDESQYLWMSTGGYDVPGAGFVCRLVVPDAATTLSVPFNFLSQEYVEWLGSGFNDTFTVTVEGSPEFLVNRTINNAADEELWKDAVPDVVSLGSIGDSQDALYNPEGSIYDGMLIAGHAGPTLDEARTAARFDISQHAGQEITLVLRLDDVGDTIYDTAVAVDGIYVF